MKDLSITLTILLLCFTGCSSSRIISYPTPLPDVDLPKYMGCWYEIATIPMSVQKECTGTTATYSLREDGSVTVVNRCRWGSLHGEVRLVTGRAMLEEPPAKFKVQFDPWWGIFARGDYWILSLDPDYRVAIIGGSNPDRLWILSRQPNLNESEYLSLVDDLAEMGYDVSRLRPTLQYSEDPSCGAG